jgi:type IV secretory pathway TraG/TraD family ATPase VirD4
MDLMHGWTSWFLGYGAVEAPMVFAMLRAKAPLKKLLFSPIAALPATVAASLGASIASPILSGMGFGVSNLMQFGAAMGIAMGTGYLTGRMVGRASDRSGIGARGATPMSGERRWSEAKESVGPGELTLAGLRLANFDETKHFKFIGTTGTGKSTAIARMLEQALARNDRAVIADPDGGYLRRFYNAERGDVILNPFDQRSLRWDPFDEIRQPYDVDQLARSLIPDHHGEDRSWRGYGRTFFTAVARQAHATGVRDVGELYRLLTLADSTELATLTRGTPAQPFLEPSNAKMFHSLRSVTSSAVASLEYVANQQSSSFSIRNWIDQEHRGKGGVLFIPYRAGQIAALRSTISAWMRIAIFGAMDRPEGDQRLWFVVDELDALGPIDGLKDALARVRKFGGRCVLGFQSVAQVASTYGDGDAHTIVENCGNTFIMRCSASEGGGTSRFASTLIGQREVRRSSFSRSRRDTELFGSSSTSDHLSIEPAVMDSEIEQIPDLCGYLKLASRAQWLRLRMAAPGSRETAVSETPAFVPVTVESVPGRDAPTGAATPSSEAVLSAVKPRRRARAKSAAEPRADAPSRRSPRSRRSNGAVPPNAQPGSKDDRGFEP